MSLSQNRCTLLRDMLCNDEPVAYAAGFA
jgi:hypothetical protein